MSMLHAMLKNQELCPVNISDNEDYVKDYLIIFFCFIETYFLNIFLNSCLDNIKKLLYESTISVIVMIFNFFRKETKKKSWSTKNGW